MPILTFQVGMYTEGDTLVGRIAMIEFGRQTGRLTRWWLSEKDHWKSGAFARLGLQKLEPVRASLPIAAKAGRSKIKK